MSRWRVCLIASVAVAVAGYVGVLTAQAPAGVDARAARTPVEPCAALLTLSLPSGGHVTSAADMSASGSTPAYCSVSIEVTDPSDPRGGLPGAINIDLTLPDTNWNGNYMAEGGGVYAGTVSPATDQLAAGYATSTTDTGHQETPSPQSG